MCELYCFLVEALQEFIRTGIVLCGIPLDRYISRICDMQEDVALNTVCELPVVDAVKPMYLESGEEHEALIHKVS